jgi:hypothetical protein
MKYINTALLGLVFAAISVTSQAAIINDASGSSFRDNWQGVVGVNFQINGADIDVNALGFEDLGLDGLELVQEVGIWDNVGTLLASVNVPSGIGGILVGDWRYAMLASTLTLLDGNSYTVGALVNNTSGNGWTDGTNSTLFSFDSSVLGSGFVGVYNQGSSLTFPSLNGGGSILRWAPANATFIPTNAVPAPATITIFALSLLGLSLGRFKRQA